MTKGQLFAEYGACHADPRNRLCHCVGIPLIVLGVLGVASLLRFGPIDLAVILTVAVVGYYATIDVAGALLCLLVFGALYVVAAHLPWTVNVAAFVAGWIFQLVGHRIEGTKPKFFENLVYLLVGPLYVVDETIGALIRGKSSA